MQNEGETVLSIESEYFRRMEPKFETLEPYGFRRSGDAWVYETAFQGGAFRAEVTVTEDEVSGRVLDTDTGEEYMPMRSPTAIGAFVGQVREDYAAILGDIAEHCFQTLPFVSDQANRIARNVRKTYGDGVEHTFPKYPEVGVFRDGPTQKWYGIVMAVSRARLERLSAEKFAKDRGEKLPPEPKKKGNAPQDQDAHPEDEIEVLNVKLDPVKIPLLEKADGFYPCYHMNRNHWITVALDGTVSDDYIMELLAESRALSIRKAKGGAASKRVPGQPLEWFVPANPKYYDVEAAFANADEVGWKQSARYEPGDIIYLYVGAPVSAIRFRCEVVAVNVDTYVNHKGKECTLMWVRKLEEYDPALLPWSAIRETGLGTAQGTKRVPPKLKALIETATGEGTK